MFVDSYDECIGDKARHYAWLNALHQFYARHKSKLMIICPNLLQKRKTEPTLLCWASNEPNVGNKVRLIGTMQCGDKEKDWHYASEKVAMQKQETKP